MARYNQVVFFFLLFYGNFWLSSCKSRARKTSVISIHQISPFQCSFRKWTDRRKPVTTIWSEFLPSVELDIQAKFQKTRFLLKLFFSLRKLNILWKLFLFIKFFNAKCKKYSRHFSFIKCRNAYLIFLVELFFTCMRFSVYFIALKMFTSSNIKFWLSGFSRTSSVFNGHQYKFLWKWKKSAFTASKCIFQSPMLSKNI